MKTVIIICLSFKISIRNLYLNKYLLFPAIFIYKRLCVIFVKLYTLIYIYQRNKHEFFIMKENYSKRPIILNKNIQSKMKVNLLKFVCDMKSSEKYGITGNTLKIVFCVCKWVLKYRFSQFVFLFFYLIKYK